MLCKKGSNICPVCGKRELSPSPTTETKNLLCFSCAKEKEGERPSQINSFITKSCHGSTEILRGLFQLGQELRQNKVKGYAEHIPGLILIDPPQHYSEHGTELCDPRMTPRNTVAFATTGGDDVHFSLVKRRRGYGDESVVIMTVPMASQFPRATNLVLGASLHEFLCLGCTHGFKNLEQLVYRRDETIGMLSIPPVGQEDDDAGILERLRKDLDLAPWQDIAGHLEGLQKEHQKALKFGKRWWSWG